MIPAFGTLAPLLRLRFMSNMARRHNLRNPPLRSVIATIMGDTLRLRKKFTRLSGTLFFAPSTPFRCVFGCTCVYTHPHTHVSPITTRLCIHSLGLRLASQGSSSLRSDYADSQGLRFAPHSFNFVDSRLAGVSYSANTTYFSQVAIFLQK